MIELKTASAASTWPLRHRVLRPGHPLESVNFPEDAMPGARHYVAVLNGTVVGVASVYPEAEPGLAEANVWRLRGMATAPEVRGAGYGSRVLAHLLAELPTLGATRIWCNARQAVSGFYERHGFRIVSEPFDMPGIGMHVVMRRQF